MISNRTDLLEEIIRKLLTQVELSGAWEDSGGRKYPPNADGWDTHGGVDLTPQEHEALLDIRSRTEPFRCPSYITHGPGNQSRTDCERRTPHGIDDEHWARDPMTPGFEWTGEKASTSYYG